MDEVFDGNALQRRILAILRSARFVERLCVSGSRFCRRAAGLPAQISDAEFSRMVSEFSEPSGIYPHDNWVSNEEATQSVIPALKQIVKPGGVYIGVAPEQNFTYIAALQARLAFIVDIRRQNLLEMLLYKALFELAPNRADFVPLLFSRNRLETAPPDLTRKRHLR
jgi:hypothetical protein